MKAIVAFVRPLLLGIALIVLVSAGLLALDDSGRKSPSAMPRVAIVQHVSQAVMDEAVRGYVEGMASQGFVDGKTVSLKFYNAQGDLPTANDIARQVTNGSFDLVLSASTVSLQAVANANKQSKVKHVFGTVANAASSGVGVSATDALDHPPYMTGISTFFPVGDALRLAREINPGLRRVGMVWHSAEINSQLYTADARKACQELGIGRGHGRQVAGGPRHRCFPDHRRSSGAGGHRHHGVGGPGRSHSGVHHHPAKHPQGHAVRSGRQFFRGGP